MRAIIALGMRHESGTALPLAECALRHPLDVVGGIEIIYALKIFGTSIEGLHALEILANQHAAHAVRIAARIALRSTQ